MTAVPAGREPLWAGDALVGSVAPGLFPRLKLPFWLVLERGTGWELQGDPTRTLHEVALAIRAAGLAHAWRDEQLPVTDERGAVVGSVERAVVRQLGIVTFAVHLAATSPDGRHWVQQRSLDKANDPGRWDTLMGGLVAAGESAASALERETWEEAGLRLAQLASLAHGGRVTVDLPARDVPGGWVIEHIDWWRCVVPAGVVPENRDGEVQQFALMDRAELARRLAADEFTHEAALVLTESAR